MPHISGFCRTTNAIEEASITAAYKIADAEAKAYLASEAIKEAEKVSRMAEETDSLLQIAKEIYERCMSKWKETTLPMICNISI